LHERNDLDPRITQQFRLVYDIGVQTGGEWRTTTLAEAGRMHLQICRQATKFDLTGGVGGRDQHPEMPWHVRHSFSFARPMPQGDPAPCWITHSLR
jgi:hypothetical protein